MAKKAAKGRQTVFLECTECRNSGQPGVSRYPTVKSKKNTTNRLELRKYCRFERKQTVHKEVKS
jgi:large subunit ribosomal protein L33